MDEWKVRGEFHEGIARDQALREKLEKASAKVEIANLGYFYKDPDSLVRFIKNCDPSAIILNWCFSEKSYSCKILERSGLLAKIFLDNERVLLTGRMTIRLDKYQEALINEMENKLLKLRDVPGRPRPHVIIHGPPGICRFINQNCSSFSNTFNDFTVFKFISKHLMITWFSIRNHPGSWLP